jgi:aspartate carbamoyltransferase catalytic subunit
MSLVDRDLVSIGDLSDSEIEAVLAVADEMTRYTRTALTVCGGRLLATLFYEPSTRTRFSFEAAMQRLGGGVISCADARTASVAKGETIADTVRTVEGYADVIVIRHPLEGAARVAADYAQVPVINAGDGAHQHPTQTLVDLFTIRRAKGRLNDIRVALCGDLKYGRTAHSLAEALARFGAEMAFVSPPGLEMPPAMVADLGTRGALITQANDLETLIGDVDVIYATRIQRERFPSDEEYQRARASYRITPELLARARPEALVMHPLPRVDELDYAIDADPRAGYFQQAANGVPVRMALLGLILGAVEAGGVGEPPRRPEPREVAGARCQDERCVTAHEHYLTPRFTGGDGAPLRCAYCERACPPRREVAA